jgi:hypothetical protein
MTMAIETRLKTLVTASTAALLLFAVVACAPKQPAGDDGSFATAEEAAAALAEALGKDDVAAAGRVLGEKSADLLSSGDPVQDKSDRANFVAAYGKAHSLTAGDDGATTLVVGENDWPFPIPLVKRADGRWVFDDEKGAQELVYRRVGRNELGAIAVCRGFVDAQRDYAAVGHDGDDAGVYAMKLISDEGLENGLYWPTEAGEEPSPAGPFVAAAAEEGYRRSEERTPYHGYHYRMLFSQGPAANGGARDYFKDGVLTEGFALVAWPAEYGSSGIMTFVVNADGVVFQKDLGEGTQEAVDALNLFDPDESWTPVVDGDEA